MTKQEALALLRSRYKVIALREVEKVTTEDGHEIKWLQANVFDEQGGVKRNFSFYVLNEGSFNERVVWQNNREPGTERPAATIRQEVDAFITKAIQAGKFLGGLVQQVDEARGYAIVQAWLKTSQGVEEKRLFVHKEAGRWTYKIIAA